MGQSFLFIFFFNLLNLASAASLIAVDTMIVVAVDVSGSIDDTEYHLQKSGIVHALSDPSVQQLLRQCSTSGIGITYVEWSGHGPSPGPSSGSASINPFVQVVPWTQLVDPRDMDEFANKILSSSRSSRGETDIARSLAFAGELFVSAPFESYNRIVSLSTDGKQGRTVSGLSTEDYLRRERDKLESLGVTINAIGVEPNVQTAPAGAGFMPTNQEATMEVYLNENVRSGPGSFVISAPNYTTYSEAFKKQLYVMMNGCIS